MIKDKIVKCPDYKCNWMQFRNVCGVQLNLQQITSLINNTPPLIENIKAKKRQKVQCRTGEYISTVELLSEKEYKQLEPKMIISKSSTSHGFCIKIVGSLRWKFYWNSL
ncbi:hypothetical protein [Chryseobacterium sp. NFX27]|uniref:hypothetical protein n=1 Tax=Chryseobacterium sp. NFX27 TaxID=2819618 RepID=UPI003CF4AEDE